MISTVTIENLENEKLPKSQNVALDMYSVKHLSECVAFIKTNYNQENTVFLNNPYIESEAYAILLALCIKHELSKSKSNLSINKLNKWCTLYMSQGKKVFDYIAFDLYTNTLWANLEYMSKCKIELDFHKKSSTCIKLTPFIQVIESKDNIIIGVTKHNLTALVPNNEILLIKHAISHRSNPETRHDFDIDDICWMAINHQNDVLCKLLLDNHIWYKILIDTMKKLYDATETSDTTKTYILGIYNKINNLNIKDSVIKGVLAFDLSYNRATDMLYANTLNIITTDLPTM